MGCPIFKAMKSGFCLDTDCRYFYPGKNKDEYCKYSERAVLKRDDNEKVRTQRQAYKKLVSKTNALDEKLKERKEKDVMCEG